MYCRAISLLVFWSAFAVTVASQAGELQFGKVEVVVGPQEPTPQTTSPGELNTPFAMEFNSAGDMILVEYDGGRIFSWSPTSGLVKLAGDGKLGYVDGAAETARFNKLHNLAILPDGRYLLSDHENHAVRAFDPSTKLVSTFAGSGKPGPAPAQTTIRDATFRQPICIALSAKKDSLLIADIENRVIRRLSFKDQSVVIVAGNGTRGTPTEGALATNTPLQDPRGAIEDEQGNLFMIERGGNALRLIDTQGRISTLAGGGTAGLVDGELGTSKMNGPKHLCFGPGGVIFIADDNNHAVRYFDPTTKQLATVDFGAYRLKRPHGVCVHSGALYVADSYHHRIVRIELSVTP